MDLLFDAWKSQGREALYRPVPTEPKPFSPRPDPAVRATLDDVAALADTKLLDTRTPEEYDGQVEMDHRPGHIPGAINLPHAELAGADGNLLIEPSLLHSRLAAVGIAPQDPVVAYCRSGVRASLAYLAMRQAGYNVRLYDGSYAEWMDSGRPVET
jgi:thiosulfate/3-mercaptopyruvate sulfurtransferase